MEIPAKIGRKNYEDSSRELRDYGREVTDVHTHLIT